MKARGINIFYIPTLYLARVRLKRSWGKLLSWWFLLIVPTLGSYLLAQSEISVRAIVSYLLLLAAVVPYYELGYMLNDTYTTRWEENPSIRLTNDEQTYFYHHIGLIMGIRLAGFGGIMCLFGLLNAWSGNSLMTIVGASMLLPVFMVYNRLRGLSAVLFYPILVFWRYGVFMLPMWGSANWEILVALMLLAYPLEISIERWSMPKRRYGFMARCLPDEKSKQLFRAVYYAVVLVLLIPLWIQQPLYSLPIFAIAIYRWIRWIWKR